MKKLLFVLVAIMMGCSSSDDGLSNCECQTIRFKDAIFVSPTERQDYTTTDCLSFWQKYGSNVEFDLTTNPITIEGPTKEQVDIGKSKAGRCN